MPKDEVVVFSSINTAECYLVRSLLTREGIASRLVGEFRAPLGGEVPLDDARTELLVAVPDQAAAEALIDQARRTDGPDRPCAACGEPNPPAFELCWSCGADVPPPPGPRAV